MTEKGRWKTIIKYTLGLVALAVTVALAIFLPEWYSAWQDERQVGQVSLASRESIQFLDVDSLDIAGRLRMLQEAWSPGAELYWDEVSYFGWNYQGTVEAAVEELLHRCNEQIQLWVDQDVLPRECESWAPFDSLESAEQSLKFLDSYIIYVNQNMFPVYVLGWPSPDYKGGMTIVIDADLGMLYYASFYGSFAMEYISGILGYDSLSDMEEKLMLGEEPKVPSPDSAANAGYASVCGAESAEISAKDSSNWLDLDITLHFDKFEGYAARRMIRTDQGYGLAMMYGTDFWPQLVNEVGVMYGYEEYEVAGSYWQEYFIKPWNWEEAYNADTGNYSSMERYEDWKNDSQIAE